jgi:hypothetical protein
MVMLRIIGMIAVILIGAGVVAFLTTGDRRSLGLAKRVGKYGLVLALVVLLLFFLERVIIL